MKRLERLINILKLTPHRQPELVKEASNRILSRTIRSDPQANNLLPPLIEILIQYCDNDDSTQRSLFNDYLNSVILTFQHQSYQLILKVLLDEVINNGSPRTVTAALQRIPHLINNVQPIELGCEPQRLLKALIEVARRTDHEFLLRALDLALRRVMPYLDYHIRGSKDMRLLSNSLIELLLRNLQNESSQIKRISAASIATICSNSELSLQNTLAKFKTQLESLYTADTNKFVGFCFCVKEVPSLAEIYHIAIIDVILEKLRLNPQDTTLVTAAFETLRELFKFQIDQQILERCTDLITREFLFSEVEGKRVIKEEVRVILQVNALACISAIVKQRPTFFDKLDSIFLFSNHADLAIRNQLIIIIGNYIEASWRFPLCVEQSISCEKIRKLWVELRSILNDDNAHPDMLKSCVIAIKTCLNTLLESDHCLHIVEYYDLDHLIELYLKSNYKPFKIEVLGLFASLSYRTLHYIEKSHWSKMRVLASGSLTDDSQLQTRIVNDVVIASLVDEHQRIRAAATNALLTIVPNLHLTNYDVSQKTVLYRSKDPIVSLANDLAKEHLIVLKQADEHINHFKDGYEQSMSSDLHGESCIKNEHKLLSSSIIQLYDNPYNERAHAGIDNTKSQHRTRIATNLMHVLSLLKQFFDDSVSRGKTAISSIVFALHELSLAYPIYQYTSSWDCRASEYCECSTLLNQLLSYLENLTGPDIIVEDLEAYKNFLALSHQILYALCHESVVTEYEHQKMKPFHRRQAGARDGQWSELTLKHPYIAEVLDIFVTHMTKLLWLLSNVIEERSNPFNMSFKQLQIIQQKIQSSESTLRHGTLKNNRLLFGRVYKKLESSFKSSKKNLNQQNEKFYQILRTCLASLSSLLEFIGMSKSMENVKDILSYLKITSPTCSVPSLICARQLLKSLFGINILALYQVDPNDWFEEESWPSTPTSLISQHEDPNSELQGVYHHLVAYPYKVFSDYCSISGSEITPNSDKELAILNFESRRALKVRRRIEERVKYLFEYNPHHFISIRVKQISESLKSTIIEFTPIVADCMNRFNSGSLFAYQNEVLYFMSYLVLLRVNYQKLALAEDLINSINKLLDQCGERMFANREIGIEMYLRNSFTFLTLLSYERGPSKPMFQVASVIRRLDDIRAMLSIVSTSECDITTYVVPLLRCLVEDLFIYRTKHFQNRFNESDSAFKVDTNAHKMDQNTKDDYEIFEAERETVAQKLLDVIDNPKVYDLLSILILESRQNPSEIKYKKLSQHLLSIIPTMLSKHRVDLMDYKCVELTGRIVENISPEVFQPVKFIFETLLESPKPSMGSDSKSRQSFQRWMSLVIITIRILITQVTEEAFLTRLNESMSVECFVEYLLHIIQLCMAEIFLSLQTPVANINDPQTIFLFQQLSAYILYLTHMFQSGPFSKLLRSAIDLIKREVKDDKKNSESFNLLCRWARNPLNGFSLDACEKMFYHIRLVYPDLTIFWCNIMMVLNNVDCNRDFWRNLLIYRCHHCLVSENFNKSLENLSINSRNVEKATENVQLENEDGSEFRRATHINRPSSLNLSDISFSDQLRRSFIKKIAATDPRDKALNRNIVAMSDEQGHLMEREIGVGNTEQCLSPNMELTRRGALCLVLDFVTISMNDVEHITWLIIHQINDIIRWSHEAPITEFINAVHCNSASSGIFIQAVNNSFNNQTSTISFVAKLLCTLRQVHYTQYGSLVVFLVQKLLISDQMIPYKSLTKTIEELACTTVKKLLNETNKSLITTNDEVFNQLTAEDLDGIHSLLDADLYPNLTRLLAELRQSAREQSETPIIELVHVSDDDSDTNEIVNAPKCIVVRPDSFDL